MVQLQAKPHMPLAQSITVRLMWLFVLGPATHPSCSIVPTIFSLS